MKESRTDKALYVLMDFKRFGPLSRRDVENLVLENRLNDDSLIRAMRGPWMRVGDFFAPPKNERVSRTRTKKIRSVKKMPAKVKKAIRRIAAAPATSTRKRFQDASETSILFFDGADEVKKLKDVRKPAKKSTAKRKGSQKEPVQSKKRKKPTDSGVLLFTGWYLMLGGNASKKLSLEAIQVLLEQGQINYRTLARHSSWSEEEWRSIRSIPDLREYLR